jgi:hypothetical protein
MKQMGKENHEIPAKMCFSHIGGKLGLLLMETFVDKGWLAKKKDSDKHLFVTAKGQKEFTKLGIDLSEIKTEKIDVGG